ncbi:MAG: hypothetical protein EI684_16040 [Candidatus Viridilinea halotolerans]|uniref:Alpha/beta hydrolase n=1 Tax=Candidatus Viridilinea halotolerans TaxID=2491704 RepID=A0A426TV85_9CHLR|nr:MAG: hypothetical protein EI684_16040 [Candidatus Viridilinea halotolerans]
MTKQRGNQQHPLPFATWGWESHAHSLPGHGASPVQRPIRWCTLQYYYEFLNTELRRHIRYQRQAAAHYGCAYHEVADTGHDLMWERSAPTTAQVIHSWLEERTR